MYRNNHKWISVMSFMLMLAVCVAACGRQNAGQVSPAPATENAGNPADMTILARIESSPAPADVDETLWRMLTAELARVVSGNETARSQSTPPGSKRDAVTDLHVIAGSGGTSVGWTHHCTGDYDLNSEVSISDLTPIGRYYGARASSWNWGEAQLADGDGNGEVNLADVTPIGVNFMVTVAAYNVFGSDDIADYPAVTGADNGPGTVFYGTVPFGNGSPGTAGRVEFSAAASGAAEGDYFWIRPSDGSTDGVQSNSTGAFARSEWWMEGKDPRHTRRSRYFGPRDSHVAWTYDFGDDVYGSPVVRGDGSIYVACRNGNLYCISPDGDLDWSYSAGDGIWTTPAIGEDGMVYFGCRDGLLYAVNPDGTAAWSIDLRGEVESPAIGGDGSIYVVNSDSRLFSISPAGAENWSYGLDGWTRCSPAIGSDGAIYIGDSSGRIHCVEQSGSMRWVYEADGEFRSSPSISGNGNLIASNTNGFLYAISQTGTELWRFQTDGELNGGVALGVDDAIYLGGESEYLNALNPDGTLRWTYFNDRWMDAAPTVAADGLLYYGTAYGLVCAVNPDGSGHWQHHESNSFSGSAVILPHGIMILCTYGGVLQAFDSGAGGTPAEVISVAPRDGLSGELVSLSADVLGTPPLSYSWDFGAGATAVNAGSRNPEIRLGLPGEYAANLTVENAFGAASQPFTLYVYPQDPGSEGWVHKLGGRFNDGFRDIAVAADGSCWLAGFHVPGAAGDGDALVAHYSAEGELLDAWTWGLPGFDMISEIQLAANGDLVCVGEYKDGVASNILLLRFTQNGTIVWERGWGTSSYDYANSLAIDVDGNIYVGGETYNTDSDIVGLRWTNTGVFDTGIYIDNDDDSIGSLVLAGSELFICGTTGDASSGDYDMLLLDLRLDGTLAWARTIGTDAYEGGRGVQQDSTGNLYIVGSGGGTICKFTPTGDLLWANLYATDSRLFYSDIDINGNEVYVTGSEYLGDVNDDIVILNIGTDGALDWCHGWRTAFEEDYGTSCAVGPLGDIYISGYAAHSNGSWESLSIAVSGFPGTVTNITPILTDESGTPMDLAGTLGVPVAVADSGGGADDAVVMRWDFED